MIVIVSSGILAAKFKGFGVSKNGQKLVSDFKIRQANDRLRPKMVIETRINGPSGADRGVLLHSTRLDSPHYLSWASRQSKLPAGSTQEKNIGKIIVGKFGSASR